MIRIAGVVVLYNPPPFVLENINSYRKQIETLYAIDNSECQNHIFVNKISKLDNVVYRWNGENLGIARALNIGARLALDRQYEYLLLMDQDSTASSNLITEFSDYLSKYSSKNIGILSPYHEYLNFKRSMESVREKEIFTTITSGTLLNLSAYERCGMFMDELFIDYVDFEYCLRLQTHGYKIIQLSDALLHHRLGAVEAKKFLFRNVAVYNHPPVRIYYKFRNRFLVIGKYFKAYPRWSMKELIVMVNELVKIFCFEKYKLEKYRMAFLGMVHYFFGRFGKYDELRKKDSR